jgi:cobalt/nickel transport system permease protein
MDDKKIPLMGVMGAFVFAAQMINFSIPGTGSSGHLGGGMLLSIMLGPYTGFLAMISILTIQAVFFADGGILALGCNIFNLGFCTCFLAYPLIFKKMMKGEITQSKIFNASMLSSIIGLQAGAFCVVLETLLSGKTEIPLGTFVMLMQPIHLGIGIVEGLVTAAIVTYVWKARPDILESVLTDTKMGEKPPSRVLAWLGISAIIIGGVFCWFASTHPDGLEWALFKSTGKAEIEASGGAYKTASDLQAKTAVMPDYEFKKSESPKAGEDKPEQWPAISGGKSFAGLAGSAMTLALAVLAGFLISSFKNRMKTSP